MARLRSDNVFGTITDNPLTNVATTMNSAGLANLVAVTGTDIAVVTLDPNRVNGAPEIVHVTAHTGAATSATILRAQEGTAARQHPSGTFWAHAATRRDFPNAMCRVTNSATQSIANNAIVALTFDTEEFDTDTMHAVTNTDRITINTAGVYVIEFCFGYAAATDYTRVYGDVSLNGTTVAVGGVDDDHSPGALSAVKLVSGFMVKKLAATDILRVRAFQTNGASAARNVAANAAASPCVFAAAWIGHG